MQPAFKGFEARLRGVSEKLFEQGLCLPSGSNLRNEELEEVVEIIKNARRN
jgi:dTDP-4-amino-4,6-dideoxygalactose transaminase